MAAAHHFVLVHGLGHGAWCWYKVTAMLQAAGHRVTALDLASSGINKTVADIIASIADYVAPLTHFLAHSVIDHQVILVGHSLGGSSISYVMELFPAKIWKAIFLNALMPISGGNFLDFEVFKDEVVLSILQMVNGLEPGLEPNLNEPTSIHVDPAGVSKVFYNKCSSEDVSLAQACLNPTPYRVIKEALYLTSERYGSLQRFYITCLEDKAVPLHIQQSIILRNPPSKVFTIPTSDHSPFLCEPHALVEILLKIAHS